MTETQAKSGAAETATTPSSAESEAQPAGNSGSDSAVATGRAVVGRASVPADKPSSESGSAGSDGADKGKPKADGGEKSKADGSASATSVPKFTRAPGMAPPPDVLVPSQSATDKPDAASTAGAAAPPSGVTPGAAGAPGAGSGATAGIAVARASVRGAATVGRVPGSTAPPVSGGAPPAGGTAPAATGPAGRVTEVIRGARATVSAAASRGPRRARLYLKRIDPWSVMKFSFAVSFVIFIVMVVATAVLYLALDQMKVFDSVNRALSEMVGATGGDTKNTFKITAKGVIIGSGLLGLVNVVLFTALATLSAFIYNVCSDLVGGIELTLAEKE